MKRYALLGERLGHSLSVPVHQAIMDRTQVHGTYRLMEIPAIEFTQTASRLISLLDGFNVTIPFKETVIPLLDGLSPAARAIGAVNTVVKGDAVTGHNTDYAGFIAMLQHYGIDPRGQRCYVLGSGGTSKTACAALRDMGAQTVTVVSRNPGEEQIGYGQLAEEFSGVLVNTTPAGMLHRPDPCPIDPAVLPSVLARAKGVVDVIYNPPETLLTASAKAAGVSACTGLYMLVHQAVEAQALWQQRPLPQNLTHSLIKELKLF